MEFADFLRQEYKLGEKSVKDYVGRWKSIRNRGIYKGETELTPSLVANVDKSFSDDSHYYLTIKRYIEYINKKK